MKGEMREIRFTRSRAERKLDLQLILIPAFPVIWTFRDLTRPKMAPSVAV